jgi:hypothetical protein
VADLEKNASNAVESVLGIRPALFSEQFDPAARLIRFIVAAL